MRAAHRIASLVLAAVAAATLWAAAAGCGIDLGASDDDARADQERTLRLARHEFAARRRRRCAAGDRAAFLELAAARQRQPGDRSRRREGLAEVFDTLAPLPWRTFSFEVTPLDPAEGVYRVRGIGQLGDAGPPDRIAVVRYFRLLAVADGAVVLADETPEDLRRRYLMALHDPLVLQRPGLIVLGDRGGARTGGRGDGRGRAGAAPARRPRRRHAARPSSSPCTGPPRTCATRSALGASTARLVFFSHPSLRVAEDSWPTYDVGVMGPWLRDLGRFHGRRSCGTSSPTPTRCSWFGDDEEPPALLVEGIAAGGGGNGRRRRRCGRRWPPATSSGRCRSRSPTPTCGTAATRRRCGLGYEIGGALVAYVVSRWGPEQAAAVRPGGGRRRALRGRHGRGARRHAGRELARVLRRLAPLRPDGETEGASPPAGVAAVQ